jgi:hypothetical protein
MYCQQNSQLDSTPNIYHTICNGVNLLALDSALCYKELA